MVAHRLIRRLCIFFSSLYVHDHMRSMVEEHFKIKISLSSAYVLKVLVRKDEGAVSTPLQKPKDVEGGGA